MPAASPTNCSNSQNAKYDHKAIFSVSAVDALLVPLLPQLELAQHQ
jgi:hypothetical protein